MRRKLLVIIALLLAACGNKGDSEHSGPSDALGDDVAVVDAGPPPPPPKLPVEPLFAEGGDENAELDAIAAVPAFDAVQYRPEYLARNGDSGAIYGRLGPEIDGKYRWLVDETDGAGSLAVRIIVADNTDAKLGDRLVVWGAWKVDDARHWYWESTKLAGLPPTDEPMPDAIPFHLATIESPPDGAVQVSRLARWGDILFEVKSSPRLAGDGWVVADRSGWRGIAIVKMPGERHVYGAQYHYSEEERWQLEKNVRYTVRVDRFSKPKGKKGKKRRLKVMTALGPPRIVTVDRAAEKRLEKKRKDRKKKREKDKKRKKKKKEKPKDA